MMGIIQATTVKKYDSGSGYNKNIRKPSKQNRPVIKMEDIVTVWKDTHDKTLTLKKLGKLFKQINEDHKNDLIKD